MLIGMYATGRGLLPTLQLLGTPRLGKLLLESVRAALLAYLALEGQTTRARLTRLLWPFQPPKRARNNLAQQLVRLRRVYPEACIVGEDPLSLAEELAVDVRLLEGACARGDYGAAIQHTGELLAGFEFDEEDPEDGDEFQREELHRWLCTRRDRLRDLQCEAFLRQIQQMEEQRRLPEALDLARQLCALADTKEEAWHAVMRLHHELGDRTAALGAYEECKSVLRRRVDVEPSEKVRQLARRIERQSSSPPVSPHPSQRPLPAEVICPPQLVGRGREWAQMEEAFAQGKPIFLLGEPGVGKSRLISDFANSKGKWIRLGARPGDREVPYASHVRNGRRLLQQRKADGRPPLPGWVVEALAPLLPELGVDRPPPVAQQDQTRLFDAATELFRDTCRDMALVVFDDGQYIDQPSFDMGMYIHNQLWIPGDGLPKYGPFPPIINGYRGSAIQPRWLEMIRGMVDLGLVALLEVKPLDAPAVAQLLRSLEIPGLEALAGEFARYTGGNPLYIVETVKHLLATGWRPEAGKSTLSLSDPVRQIIRRRLKALSPAALEVARVIAVAQANTSLDVVAAVLEVRPVDLVEPCRELEEQGVLSQEWFTHDVLGEVLLEDTPELARASLRKRLDEHRPKSRAG